MPKQHNVRDINLKTIDIHTSFGLYDLKPHFVELSVFENIFQPFLTADLALSDSYSIQQKLPIVGQETVDIDIILSGFEGFQDQDYISIKPPKMHVNEISAKFFSKPKTQNFSLQLISDSFMSGLDSKVSKSYKDQKISSIVSDIFFTYLNSGGRGISIEPTDKIENIIIPNLRPIKAIQWLAKRAVKDDAVNYLYYETMNTPKFVSLNNLANEEPVKTLIFKPRVDDATGVGHIAANTFKINKFSFKKSFDKKDNIVNGVYSSKLITHDIINKKIRQYECNLFKDWPKLNHCGDFPPISNSLVETKSADVTRTSYAPNHENSILSTKQKELSRQVDSQVSFYPKHGNLYGDFYTKEYDNEVEKWYLQRAIHTGIYTNYCLVLELAGNSALRVGHTVTVILPSPETTDGDKKTDSAEDKSISGKYMVTAIQHIFGRESNTDPRITYNMKIEVVKDGLDKEVSIRKPREG